MKRYELTARTSVGDFYSECDTLEDVDHDIDDLEAAGHMVYDYEIIDREDGRIVD